MEDRLEMMLEKHLQPFKDEEQRLAYIDAVYEKRKLLSPKMANLVSLRRSQIYEAKGDKASGGRTLEYYLKAGNGEKAFEEFIRSYKYDNSETELNKILDLFETDKREKLRRKAYVSWAKQQETSGKWKEAAEIYKTLGDYSSYAACHLKLAEDGGYTPDSKRVAEYYLERGENNAAAIILESARNRQQNISVLADLGCLLVERDLIKYNEREYYYPRILADCRHALEHAVKSRRIPVIKKLNSMIERLTKEVKNERY
jgi:tetratricopeptide (TPR) repeat protein